MYTWDIGDDDCKHTSDGQQLVKVSDIYKLFQYEFPDGDKLIFSDMFHIPSQHVELLLMSSSGSVDAQSAITFSRLFHIIRQ